MNEYEKELNQLLFMLKNSVGFYAIKSALDYH